MANASTLYRFKLEISDVDRSVYEKADLRIAMHPSETESYLLTRVLAYALNYEDGLEVSPGLCVDDEPAIYLSDPGGGFRKWIEIGNPSARRLHKAAKASRSVKVYTYKDPENLRREVAGEKIHRSDEIELFAFSPPFLKALGATLGRENAWGVIHNEGELVVTVGDESFIETLTRQRL